MIDFDLGWVAGLLEGEACFRSHTTRYTKVSGEVKLYLYPSIVVNMTDFDVIDRLHTMLGGRTYGPMVRYCQGKRVKDQMRWELFGQPAADLMSQILPHMSARRSAKIHEVLRA